MSVTSAVPAMIDALLSTLNTAFPSTVLVAGQPVQVFDGVGNTEEDTGRQVWVGMSDPFNADPNPESATSTQTWPYDSTQFRREEITVHLVAQAWTGDADTTAPKIMRDAVYVIADTVTTAIVTNASLGSAVLMVRDPATNMTLRQTQDDKGALAQLAWDVTAMAQFQG